MSERMGRTSWRRLVGATTGAGALAIVSIMALSSVASAGVAHPASFPGAYWSPYRSLFNEGCAQAHGYPAHWSATTGHGTQKGAVSAKQCPAYRGGNNVYSESDAFQELTVYAPATMPSGSGGINVSWNLKAGVAISGGQTNTSLYCPPGTLYTYSYWYGYTWFNYSYQSTNCEAGANAELFAGAYLVDMTTGSYYYSSNYWYQFNWSGDENDSYTFSYTYSNSSYWIYNYSYSYSFNSTSPNVNTVWNVAPTFFINGTFVSTDTYQVITYVDASMLALAFGFPGAHGASSINMAGKVNHENLLPFSIW